jgi:hypothetical protein
MPLVVPAPLIGKFARKVNGRAVSRQDCFSAATRRCSFAFLITTRYVIELQYFRHK